MLLRPRPLRGRVRVGRFELGNKYLGQEKVTKKFRKTKQDKKKKQEVEADQYGVL